MNHFVNKILKQVILHCNNLGEQLKKKESQNCWEFWNCRIKQDCPAYQNNSGKECWLIASHKCPQVNQGKADVPKVNDSFQFCWQCPWFKKLNPNFDKENSAK